MARIAPQLRLQMARQRRAAAGAPQLLIAMSFEGPLQALLDAGFEPRNLGPDTAVGLATPDVIDALAGLPEVVSIDAVANDRPNLDRSVSQVGAGTVWARQGDRFTGYTGLGVLVGIVDSGIDFRHPSFRHPDGSSRVLRIWDQTLTAEAGECVPGPITDPAIATETTPLGYGVEYTVDEINAVLAAESAEREGRPTPAVLPVRHVDADGHGTHVAGIAAGDGSQAGHGHGPYTYVGMAPAANLLVVRKAGLSKGDVKPPLAGDTLLEAVRYLLDRARDLGKPMVINLSLGHFSEQVDGTQRSCVKLDQLLQAHPQGRAIVISSGNEADRHWHAHAVVRPGNDAALNLDFRMSSKLDQMCALVVRYQGSGLQVMITSPLGERMPNWQGVGPFQTYQDLDGPGGSVLVDSQPDRIDVELTPRPNGCHVEGTWTLTLRNAGGADVVIDAYAIFDDSQDHDGFHFTTATSPRSTLNPLAAGFETVAVGSCHAARLSIFSSRGPTLDLPPRTLKPEIVAPGEWIASAGIPRNRDICCCAHVFCACCDSGDADYHWYVDMNGTSMAAPHVTGAVALMLHKNPNLTNRQIRQLLIDHATPPPPEASADDRAGWGAGLLNVQQTLDAVVMVRPPVEPLATPQSVFRQLQASVMDLPQGPHLHALVQAHGNEVWTLIQTHRRVATAWHRSHGPVWVRLALGALSAPDEPVDLRADGQALRDSVKRLAQSLDRHGSPALRDAVRTWAPVLAALPTRASLRQLLQALGRFAPAVDHAGGPK